MRTILSCLALLFLTSTAFAAQASLDRVKLKNGEWLSGEAKRYDPKTETLTFIDEDGTEQSIHIDELDPRSAYRAANSLAKTADAARLVRIGNFARDIGLYAHAARHYNDAVKKDPSLQAQVDAEMITLKREAAEFCMRNAEEAKRKGDARGAEKWLTTLVQKLPDEPLAEKAAAMLASESGTHREAKDDELESSHEDLLKGDLKTGKLHYDRMLEKIKAGLTGRNNTKEFESAYKEGEKALKELDKVQKRLDQPELKEVFDGYRVLVKEHMVEALLSVASIHTTRTSYNQALAEVNKALALDPGNKDALAARGRIEIASSSGW